MQASPADVVSALLSVGSHLVELSRERDGVRRFGWHAALASAVAEGSGASGGGDAAIIAVSGAGDGVALAPRRAVTGIEMLAAARYVRGPFAVFTYVCGVC